jgi:hypothetical protein
MRTLSLIVLIFISSLEIFTREYHVSIQGDDGNSGSVSQPFRTIMAAARIAQAGDVITVHEGVYRERIDPPRGGVSDEIRIVYQAVPGENVVIKGSEIIKEWIQVENEVWMVSLPNSFFSSYNPYSDIIGTDWFNDKGRDHHTGEVYLNNKSLYEVETLEDVIHPEPLPYTTDPEGSVYVWYCQVDDDSTTIYANFHKYNPNKENVEINVREACFYPSKPGINYITVRGFNMSQAACQWSTATDEQNGLIGTHWSKGWIIENNIITHSKNIGIALGKDRKSGHRLWTKNKERPGYLIYNEVIVRALLESGWSKDNIGSHIVRNNIIYDCEKNGIHGSLGAVFCRIENNHIFNIYTKRQYSGADIGGIKILGAIDVLIKNNHIHDAYRGMWMDWMAQGTRITSNLVYNNDQDDLFVEVNHGPFVIDNNLFLSGLSLSDWSHGGAYVHNLFAGKVTQRSVLDRKTPYHKAHSTMIAGFDNIHTGDSRFYNNIFAFNGLNEYDSVKLPMYVSGNVYLNQAQPYSGEETYILDKDCDPQIRVTEKEGNVLVQISLTQSFDNLQNILVTTDYLGRACIPDLPFEDYNGAYLKIDRDYYGNYRDEQDPSPGPFENIVTGSYIYKVW